MCQLPFVPLVPALLLVFPDRLLISISLSLAGALSLFGIFSLSPLPFGAEFESVWYSRVGESLSPGLYGLPVPPPLAAFPSAAFASLQGPRAGDPPDRFPVPLFPPRSKGGVQKQPRPSVAFRSDPQAAISTWMGAKSPTVLSPGRTRPPRSVVYSPPARFRDAAVGRSGGLSSRARVLGIEGCSVLRSRGSRLPLSQRRLDFNGQVVFLPPARRLSSSLFSHHLSLHAVCTVCSTTRRRQFRVRVHLFTIL